MVKIYLTFDVEEKNNNFKCSRNGLENIIKLIDKYHFKSIFFITANFAKKYPSLIKKIAEKYEIACHGYLHEDKYDVLETQIAIKRLGKAKEILEKISGKKIISFRAPRMKPPSQNVIKEVGFKYDFSLHPTWVPGRYFNLLKPRKKIIKNGVTLIPATVTPLFRLPLSWFWFDKYPLWVSKILTKFALINQDFLCIYFHSWEFTEFKKINKFKKYLDFLAKLRNK